MYNNACKLWFCIIGSVQVVMLPKKAPAKATPGKTTKTPAERKEFAWSDNEVQLLLDTAANYKA